MDGKNPHIRNIQEKTTIKMDINSSEGTMDTWIPLDEKKYSLQQART